MTMSNPKMDQHCFKCPAVLVCLLGVFDPELRKCIYCQRQNLVVTVRNSGMHKIADEKEIPVTCNKYKHIKETACDRCFERLKNKVLP